MLRQVTYPFNSLSFQDMAIGSGATPQLGDRVAVHYSLYYNGFEVESSRDSSGLAARPFGFNWGTKEGNGAIVKGVQEGMSGMQVVSVVHYCKDACMDYYLICICRSTSRPLPPTPNIHSCPPSRVDVVRSLFLLH